MKGSRKIRNLEEEEVDTQSGEGTTPTTITTQGLWGQSGPGRDHKLVHPTMCASFLAGNEGSSISDVEVAGIVSSRGSKPLLSIRLENIPQD